MFRKKDKKDNNNKKDRSLDRKVRASFYDALLENGPNTISF